MITAFHARDTRWDAAVLDESECSAAPHWERDPAVELDRERERAGMKALAVLVVGLVVAALGWAAYAKFVVAAPL